MKRSDFEAFKDIFAAICEEQLRTALETPKAERAAKLAAIGASLVPRLIDRGVSREDAERLAKGVRFETTVYDDQN